MGDDLEKLLTFVKNKDKTSDELISSSVEQAANLKSHQ